MAREGEAPGGQGGAGDVPAQTLEPIALGREPTRVLTQRDLWVSSGGTKGANVVSCNSSFGIDFADCNTPTYKPWNDAYDLMGQSGILNAAATINGNYNVDVIPALDGKTVSDGRPNLHGAALAILSWGCSGSVSTYCTAKVDSQGCTPVLAASGTPSASSPSSFDIGAWNLINSKSGILSYGLNGPAGLPFQGGFLCTTPPLKRTPVQNSGGNPPPDDCSGLLFLDLNAWIQGGSDPNLLPGVQVNSQVWYRDPASASRTGLTDAVELTICN